MATEEQKERIRKLLAHAESAAKIGNETEAKSYKTHARTLMRRHKITKKSLTTPPPVKRIQGTWECSCGMALTLDIEGDGLAIFYNNLIFSHNQNGHRLVKVA